MRGAKGAYPSTGYPQHRIQCRLLAVSSLLAADLLLLPMARHYHVAWRCAGGRRARRAAAGRSLAAECGGPRAANVGARVLHRAQAGRVLGWYPLSSSVSFPPRRMVMGREHSGHQHLPASYPHDAGL